MAIFTNTNIFFTKLTLFIIRIGIIITKLYRNYNNLYITLYSKMKVKEIR